jgi:hypothetical protein
VPTAKRPGNPGRHRVSRRRQSTVVMRSIGLAHRQKPALQRECAGSYCASRIHPPNSCQAGFMNSQRKLDRGRCRPFGKCARLRTIESRKTRRPPKAAQGNSVRSGRHSGLKSLFRRYRRHEKPVRTRFLTSVARCQCSHPNSQNLLSPIPKVDSAALARQSTPPSTDSA